MRALTVAVALIVLPASAQDRDVLALSVGETTVSAAAEDIASVALTDAANAVENASLSLCFAPSVSSALSDLTSQNVGADMTLRIGGAEVTDVRIREATAGPCLALSVPEDVANTIRARLYNAGVEVGN